MVHLEVWDTEVGTLGTAREMGGREGVHGAGVGACSGSERGVCGVSGDRGSWRDVGAPSGAGGVGGSGLIWHLRGCEWGGEIWGGGGGGDMERWTERCSDGSGAWSPTAGRERVGGQGGGTWGHRRRDAGTQQPVTLSM